MLKKIILIFIVLLSYISCWPGWTVLWDRPIDDPSFVHDARILTIETSKQRIGITAADFYQKKASVDITVSPMIADPRGGHIDFVGIHICALTSSFAQQDISNAAVDPSAPQEDALIGEYGVTTLSSSCEPLAPTWSQTYENIPVRSDDVFGMTNPIETTFRLDWNDLTKLYEQAGLSIDTEDPRHIVPLTLAIVVRMTKTFEGKKENTFAIKKIHLGLDVESDGFGLKSEEALEKWNLQRCLLEQWEINDIQNSCYAEEEQDSNVEPFVAVAPGSCESTANIKVCVTPMRDRHIPEVTYIQLYDGATYVQEWHSVQEKIVISPSKKWFVSNVAVAKEMLQNPSWGQAVAWDATCETWRYSCPQLLLPVLQNTDDETINHQSYGQTRMRLYVPKQWITSVDFSEQDVLLQEESSGPGEAIRDPYNQSPDVPEGHWALDTGGSIYMQFAKETTQGQEIPVWLVLFDSYGATRVQRLILQVGE